MSDPCAHGDRGYTCGACVQRYCAVCQGPACPHPAREIEPAPPLDEKEIERLRETAQMCAEAIDKAGSTSISQSAPWGLWSRTRDAYQFAVSDPLVLLRVLSTLGQERALRQAAEQKWKEAVLLLPGMASEEGYDYSHGQDSTWAALWKRVAVLYRSKVRLQQEKIDRQREHAQQLEHSNAGLRGSAKEWRRKVQAAETALAEERNVTDGWRRSHEKTQEERLHESQQAWERINQLIIERDRATNALAEERQARETAEIERDSFRDMWTHGRRAADLAVEEMEQSDAKATEWARRVLDTEAERDQALAALAACEARLAEADRRIVALEHERAEWEVKAVAHPAPPPAESARLVDRIAPEDRADGPACG